MPKPRHRVHERGALELAVLEVEDLDELGSREVDEWAGFFAASGELSDPVESFKLCA